MYVALDTSWFIEFGLYFVPSPSMRYLIFFILSAFQLIQAQTAVLIESTPLAADRYVGTDSYKNIYFIEEMAFYKNGPDGTYVFKDFSLGPISKIDLINPLKILLFYQETNTAVFLDNRLNEIERINFNTLTEFTNVLAAGNAGNNRLWLFNADTQQLELYDYRAQRKTFASQPFAGELQQLTSNFNFCYLLFDDALISFNIYGSFLSELMIADVNQTTQMNENVWLTNNANELFFIAEPGLHSLQKASKIKKVALPEITIKQLHPTQDFLYIYDGISLHTFSVKQPKN